MGADGGIPGSLNRSNVVPSSDVSQLPQYLSLEPISLGNQKYMRSGELRRALGVPLVNPSEDHMPRGSSLKPSTPIATEDLKQFKQNVLNASSKARTRLKIFRNSIHKIDKYTEVMGSRKRQRADLLSVEKPGSSLPKTAVQPPRIHLDQSTGRLEDRRKVGGMTKRFRSPAAELRVDSKSGLVPKDQMINEKGTNISTLACGTSIQTEERHLRLSAVGEGWDKNMKRKRSVGTVANRLTDNVMKRTMQSKLSTDTKLAPCDASPLRSNAKQGNSSGTPGTVLKGKISRAPRTGSIMAVNSSDFQASSEGCEGLEQPTSSNKVVSLGSMKNRHCAANSSHMLGQWAGQRQQKSSRSRRTRVLPPLANHDEGQSSSLATITTGNVRTALNVNTGCLDTFDVHNKVPKSKIDVESTPSPVRLSVGEEMVGLDYKAEEKEKDISEAALNGRGKVRAFVIPTKRNKNFVNENAVDGVRRQGRTVRGLPLSRPGVSQSEPKLDSMPMVKCFPDTRQGSEKIRGKSGRPPARKMPEGRVTCNLEPNDDHEELLAAAVASRKASYLACSGRFWKKLEPVFGSISSQDKLYLKKQLSFAEELEDSQSVISCAENNLLGVMCRERADAPSGKKGCEFTRGVDKNDLLPVGLIRERPDKFSSLYQRVLSALIEEDESEGCYNGYEGMSMSIQCASDDSHCGSCNHADTETRDRDRVDRFDSEAESMVDFQMQKRCSGDRFSYTKSVTSNTTWNTSMSDSVYSSGRWLGDDGVSYSDAEFISGSCQNDGGPHSIYVTPSLGLLDCQYPLMCVDDKLLMELQSIGLYPDEMPDLAEGEVIDRDLIELKEGLYDQIGKKKDNLVKLDRAVQDDSCKEQRFMEQVAMEQLIQMAYKRRMACRRNNTSKTVMRRVSKHVALGFIERTLARCKNFEVTGRSCFSEPALQNVLVVAPQGNDAGVNVGTDVRISRAAPHLITKTDAVSPSMPGSSVDDPIRGTVGSPQAVCHSSDLGFGKIEPVSDKGKKREVLLENVGGASSRCTTAYDSPLNGGGQRKKSERVDDFSPATLILDTGCQIQSVEDVRGVGKPKGKIKQNTASVTQSLSIPNQEQNTGNEKNRELWSSSSGKDMKDASEDPEAFDPMIPDIDNFFDCEIDLQDDDYGGLDIPMDDLFSVL